MGEKYIMIKTRYFNQLKINEEDNTITKTSFRDILKYEINYYLEIKHTVFVNKFVKVVKTNDMITPYSITMEYCNYKPLSYYYLDRREDFRFWKNTAIQLYKLIVEFRKKECITSNVLPYRENFFINKNLNRINEFLSGNNPIKEYLEKGFILNNIEYQSIYHYIEKSLPFLKEISNDDPFVIVHGDLCFSNILSSFYGDDFKLIDPRGDFGGLIGIYGDIDYDISKLRHSLFGCYDKIINNFYNFYQMGNKFYLDFYNDNFYKNIQNIFCEIFHGLISNQKVRLLEAWLFLSMLPLHKENEIEQAILALRGIQLLKELLEEK